MRRQDLETAVEVQTMTAKSIAGSPIAPGATIGMVGGGQLGRMFAIAAAQMGYRVGVFCGSPDEPAAQVAAFHVCAPLDDRAAIDAFAAQCDVITLEFENIPAATIAACGRHAPTYPHASVLATAQDRLEEKSTLRAAGLPVTPFASASDAASLSRAAETLGWPLIVKTRRSGYDGKGQHRLAGPDDAAGVDWSGGGDWIAEAVVPFDCEVSVIVARSSCGETATFPVLENDHRHHVLETSCLPASIGGSLADRARQIAVAAAEHLDVVGLLCVEMFVVGDEVLINEVAPRPHNSGHLTIEGCHTSQFEQHVRAICGLPLGRTDLVSPAAGMINLLGDLWSDGNDSPDWASALAVPGVRLHLYAKGAARKGRKMGHLTLLGATPQEVLEQLRGARQRAGGSPPR